MSGMSVGGPGASQYDTQPAEADTDAPQNSAPPAGGRLSLEQEAALPTAELAKLPTSELVKVAENYPEAAACLPLAKLTEVGNAKPGVMGIIFHSSAATVPTKLPSGYATGTHVMVPNSGVDLPWIVQQGVNAWKGKEFKPASGEMEDHVGILPDSKAKLYIGDINAAVQGAAAPTIVPPVEDEGKALITDYTQASQAFGVKLKWVDEFRQLPNGNLLGVSYWVDGGEPKKWAYVLLNPPK
jgi:hypothetical protein